MVTRFLSIIRIRFFSLSAAWLAVAALLTAPFAVADDVANTAKASDKTIQMRLWTTPEQMRLVIETAKPITYKSFWLRKPPRLVLDVATDLRPADFLNREDIRAAPYLHTARSAHHNGNTRFVFEPAADISFEPRIVPPVAGYGHRIILDIVPQNRPDPLLSLIKSLTKSAVAPSFLAVIDPGHGGEDPGAVSPNKSLEKDVVLQIAHRIKNAINARPGMRAVLTRKDDRFLPLAQRVRTAQRLKADAFVSVHADSVESPKAMGSSVYMLSRRGASSRLARRLAKHANLADLVGGAAESIGSKLQTNEAIAITRDGTERDSRRMAELLISKISRVNAMHKKHVESAGFAVLKSLQIPSVLVETAFISNPTEERKLLNKSFQQKMARAVADGLQEYHERYSVKE